MKISNKLQKWVDQGLISKKQAEKIMLSEQSNNSNMAWKLMYWIAGLLIGVGFILIIGANWDDIPAPIKLLGDFGIWAGILYGTYWSVLNKKDTLKEYIKTTNRRVTFEYILLDGVNDTIECAEELAKLVKNMNCYINLIPYNEVCENEFRRSDKDSVRAFYEELKRIGVNVTIRKEFGSDIDAACGQLRAKKEGIIGE